MKMYSFIFTWIILRGDSVHDTTKLFTIWINYKGITFGKGDINNQINIMGFTNGSIRDVWKPWEIQ